MTRFDNELKELEATIKAKKQAIAEADLQIQKMEHDIVNLKKEQSNAEHLVENLEKQFEWIAEEYENFGKPGSQYDFKSVDIGRLRDKSRELEAKQKGMKKKINPKVINMIDRWV